MPLAPRDIAIAIFARAPVAGRAKTRLIPALGAERAAALQRFLIERTVALACESRLGPVSLWCAPNSDHECFHAIESRHGVLLREQIDADLGQRMHHIFDELGGPALLVGTDCAVLTADHLVESASRLARHDAVVVPVEDGGYILIGLKKPAPHLFADVAWSTNEVMTTTRLRAREAGIALAELPTLWDIDRVEDYARAIAGGHLQADVAEA